MKLKSKFEAWAMANGFNCDRVCGATKDSYLDEFTVAAWDAWQAALDSVQEEIEEQRSKSPELVQRLRAVASRPGNDRMSAVSTRDLLDACDEIDRATSGAVG